MLVEFRTPTAPITIPVLLDSGAERTLVNREQLEQIGFDPPKNPDPKTDPSARRFEGVAGGSVLGYLFDVELRVVGTGVVHDCQIYGSLEPIRRSVLGRDFFSRCVVGFHDAGERVYLDSLRNRDVAPIVKVRDTKE